MECTKGISRDAFWKNDSRTNAAGSKPMKTKDV
eukprot:CAMPEP_0206492310 /NCGR_PEP_ID=MMETSP0324_2-20121206/45950_1 /ASSEMBLY_ACC=CAM_ASM_000836 /TAXON_ID=2866 /ORGANISM="Crypthecodinium cohnii, Strain Seligo" /LENGTH=32 /DNA_ID= /DNA_START= /DNA_END= /DNA_ORIENTATION=